MVLLLPVTFGFYIEYSLILTFSYFLQGHIFPLYFSNFFSCYVWLFPQNLGLFSTNFSILAFLFPKSQDMSGIYTLYGIEM